MYVYKSRLYLIKSQYIHRFVLKTNLPYMNWLRHKKTNIAMVTNNFITSKFLYMTTLHHK